MIARIAKVIGCLVLAAAVIAGAYLAYVFLNYYRVGDAELSIEGSASHQLAEVGQTYSIATYNIGFGAYQQDYTCVMDKSLVRDSSGAWVEVSGTNLKALSREDAQRNTEGALSALASLHTDFAFLQEIDTESDRCYGINQVELAQQTFAEGQSAFALNFHTPFFVYPINDMMGRAQSGILTLSKYALAGARRYEFAVTDGLIAKQFDLDRCFSASYANVDDGKQLVLVNLHMSAYDEGGVIREQQRKRLYSFIQEEYEKGNYVIVGGDFNHDLLTNNPSYPEYTEAEPAFENQSEKSVDPEVRMFDEQKSAGLPDGFTVVAADNAGSCRRAATPWNPGTSSVSVIDGFLVSSNVKVLENENVATSINGVEGFAYSDHDPAWMSFQLVG